MQPDLPWNVAGIPPEAREAARASARREGLSVGEWLTRRILRSMTEGNSNVESARDSWRYSGLANQNPAFDAPPSNGSRDSQDMLARVSRTEADSLDANRRIEDQLRGVARRLDQAERSQSENNRAMSKAATEINIAAREQAQAFDQLGAHVVGLNDRLARIERDNAGDGVREAVKALHQGLSRLADQMSQTAHQSASQIEALAGSVEQVAGKVADTRHEVDQVSHAFADRVAGIEARLRNAERDVQAQVGAIEKALGSVEASREAARGDRSGIESELQHQAAALSQLNETLDRLSTRFAAGEAQQSGAMARLEDNIARLDARGTDPSSERRLQGIEHALTDIVSRLEKTESSNLGAAGTVEEGLRSLAQRVDAADKRHRDAVAELRAAVKEATGSLETIEPPPPPASPAPPPPAQHDTYQQTYQQPLQQAAMPNFDLPPFPDHGAQGFQPPPFANMPPVPDSPQPFGTDPAFAGHPFGADAFAANATQQAGAAGAESFLAAARRSAQAAASGNVDQGNSPFGFTWGPAREPEAAPKSNVARYALIATLGFVIVAAVAAGVILSRNLSTPQQVVAPARTVLSTPAPSATTIAPTAATPEATANTASQITRQNHMAVAPGSPVIVVPHHVKPLASSAPRTEQAGTAPVATTKLAAIASPKSLPVAQTPATSDRLSALASTGNAKAELLYGLKLLDGEGVTVNEAEAAKWLERAAKQNEPVAAYRLGTLYERGHGVPADAAKATQWYEAAAKGGNRKAMHNLAVAYAGGTGVQKDLVVAAQWFTRAANLGLADSQFNLAVLYERGMGVQQSLIDAYKWYAVAAQQGDAESKARLDALSTQLTPEDKTAAQKAAASFRPDATDRNANIPPEPSMVLGG
jgi:localization factor PodJL